MRNLLFFLFSHRTLALIRWDIHFLGVRLRNTLFNRESILKSFFGRSGRKFLNLGSGPRGKDDPEWLNIDGFPDRNVHFMCDFGRRIPITPSSLDGVFTEHVVEHFDYDNGRKLLLQCFHMLKKDGVVRIVVPDGHKILKRYFEEPDRILEYKECETGHAMEAVNKWFYQRYEHQYIYDAHLLGHLLREIGFSRVEQSSYMQSRFGAVDLLLDDPKYEWESLYMEAVK
jgi:predicted SAM-dependent methyltransferase